MSLDWMDFEALERLSKVPFPDTAWGTDQNGTPWKDYPTLVPAEFVDKQRISPSIVPPVPHESAALELLDVFRLAALRGAHSEVISRQVGPTWPEFEEALRDGCGYVGVPSRGVDPFAGAGATHVAKFVYEILRDTVHTTFVLKKQIARARPYHVDPSLSTWFAANGVPLPAHPSYPSGHSSEAHAIAFALGDLLGAESDRRSCRAKLMQCALAIAVNREIAGVHFRSDTIAGMHVARWVMRQTAHERVAALRPAAVAQMKIWCS